MPPEPLRVAGAAAVGEFLATRPLQGRLDEVVLRSVRANGQPALAAYAGRQPYGVMVFALREDRIAGITAFVRQPALLGPLGLPGELTA